MFDCKNQIFVSPLPPLKEHFYYPHSLHSPIFFNPAEQVWKKQKETGGSD
jgi:hypothetical protein